MTPEAEAARDLYVRAVHRLRDMVEPLRNAGWSDEQIACHLVHQRNLLKKAVRRRDLPEDVKRMEARNMAIYGDPVGAGPQWFYRKYGSWAEVIEAACRPADLRQGL